MPRPVLLRPSRCLALTALLAAGPAAADEGQWMPAQIAELDRAKLQEMGLEVAPEQLWNDRPMDGGLMRAAVNLGGCTASFISADGLLATNHHCAYSAIQGNSSVEHDYLKDGFVARARGEELPAKDATVKVIEKIDDVTAEILAVADAASDDRARAQAIDRKRKELVDACERAGSGLRCEVATFYSGSLYQRFAYRELRDVRLVYAPPSAIGEFGGEVDNWMWPRHTGDFSLLRAYAGADNMPADHAATNVPYKPAQFLKVSADGVKAGDFVAVLGYPGQTQRYLPGVEVERFIDQVYPGRIDLYGEWIAILEELGGNDPAVGIKVASTKKSLANRFKNAQGMISGLRAMNLVQRRRDEEAALERWASKPDNAGHADVLAELRALSQDRRDGFGGEFLLDSVSGGGVLGIAVDAVRRAREAKKPDLERATGYMDRDLKKLRDKVERRVRDHDPEVEAHLLAAVLVRASRLKTGRIAAFERLIADGGGGVDSREAYLAATRKLMKATRLGDKATAVALLEQDEAALAGRRDPVLELAIALVPELEALDARNEARSGRMARVGPRYFTMLRTVREGPVYPDANGTLRFSYAKVAGYSPREALIATPQTTLTGQLAKVTGTPPFALPEKVLAQAAGAKDTYWSDPALGDLPIALLSDADTTGGNSGSPAINGRGELVGLNFDRVWENIAGDFGYNPARSRNVIVDVRYMLWLLDRVDDAGVLLDELGVGDKRTAGPRPASPATSDAPAPATATTQAGKRGAPETCPPGPRSCGCAGGEAAGWGGLVVVALAWRRRRRG
jgi:MYXO-CTERM domain-containing protein